MPITINVEYIPEDKKEPYGIRFSIGPESSVLVHTLSKESRTEIPPSVVFTQDFGEKISSQQSFWKNSIAKLLTGFTDEKLSTFRIIFLIQPEGTPIWEETKTNEN